MTEAQINEAVLLYGDGWTLHNLGRHLGVADQAIRRALVGRGAEQVICFSVGCKACQHRDR